MRTCNHESCAHGLFMYSFVKLGACRAILCWSVYMKSHLHSHYKISDIQKVRNALVNPVYCVMEYTICSMASTGTRNICAGPALKPGVRKHDEETTKAAGNAFVARKAPVIYLLQIESKQVTTTPVYATLCL
jgi:hypothetical protein